MKNQKIYAVIISFNGNSEVINTVNSIRDQVSKVVVVDNHSDASTLKILDELSRTGIIDLIKLNDNYGIAYAQNSGIDIAYKEGAEWVLTLDQDSLCEQGMVAKLLSVAERFGKDKIGFCCPLINYQENNVDRKPSIDNINYAISSGCLFPIATLKAIGPQCVEYFIDSVDFDYCLRLTASGYRMLRVNEAVLDHRLGTVKKFTFLGLPISISIHAPFRRYYLVRNHIFLVKSYWMSSPLFLLKKTLFLFILFFQIFIFEDRKMENLKQCTWGVIDGLRRRGGKNPHCTHV